MGVFEIKNSLGKLEQPSELTIFLDQPIALFSSNRSHPRRIRRLNSTKPGSATSRLPRKED